MSTGRVQPHSLVPQLEAARQARNNAPLAGLRRKDSERFWPAQLAAAASRVLYPTLPHTLITIVLVVTPALNGLG